MDRNKGTFYVCWDILVAIIIAVQGGTQNCTFELIF